MSTSRSVDGNQFDLHTPASRVLQARANEASEEAVLHGQKALTPIIAGTISGTCVGVAWLVALIVILLKRYRRKQRYRKVDEATKAAQEQRRVDFIVPPDPAVLEGGHQPGERVIIAQKRRWWKGRRRSGSISGNKGKGKERPVSHKRTRSVPGLYSQGEDDQDDLRQNGEDITPEETIELRPHPPFQRLATIMSVGDYQRSRNSTPQNGDVSAREDVTAAGFARSPNTSTSRLREKEPHNYPPARR